MWRLISTQVTTVKRIMSSQPMKTDKWELDLWAEVPTQHVTTGKSQLFWISGSHAQKKSSVSQCPPLQNEKPL